MKSILNLRNSYFLVVILSVVILFMECTGIQVPEKKDTINKQNNRMVAKPTDSLELTMLIRKLYKWHETTKMKYNGFNALKQSPSDTLYTSIDLEENKKAIEELKESGFFTDSFLNDYRNIAIRMDKELKDGSSLWPDGELSTFGDDSDPWCNCQDFPVDKYWEIIKLTDIHINNNTAKFSWTWGGDFYYNVKALKEEGNWKISYLQGFDMNAYSWEWWKKNKK
jgi:hypothetical protein